ncbi:MAG: hypothetical protein AAF092_10025 [Pseudomonadota bacterium]
MASEIEAGISAMFRDVVGQSCLLEMRTQQDWDAFKEIQRTARQREAVELKEFRETRDSLIADEKRRLIDEGGSFTFEHPTPSGTDHFNPHDIAREAEARVDRAHQSRLIAIREEEAEAYADLAETIRAREGLQGWARQDFNRSTDRRSEDRRGGSERSWPSRD